MKITLKNYEEFALDYLEGRLDEKTRTTFEEFLEQHPEIREELQSIRPLNLPEAPSSEYPGKEALLRDSAFIRAIRRPLYIPVWSIAACLLLLFGFFLWWNVTAPEQSTSKSVAVQPQFESPEKANPLQELRKNRKADDFFTGTSQSEGTKDRSIAVSSIKEQHSGNTGNTKRYSRSKDLATHTETREEVPAESRTTTRLTSDPLKVASVSELSIELDQEEVSLHKNLISKQTRISPLKQKQLEILDLNREQLPELQTIQPETSDREEGFFLSDELAGLTPSSWSGKVKSKDLKEAFVPRAFSD